MSYPEAQPVPAPAPQGRPGVVSAAVGLLFLVAVLEVISAGVSALQFPILADIMTSEFAGEPEAETFRTAINIAAIFGILLSVAFTIGYVVLAVFVGKGKQPARIITWVLAGLSVLCTGCGLAGNAVGSSFSNMGSDPTTTAMQDRFMDAIPAWHTAVITGVSVVSLLSMIAVIVLLALPAANDFFRPAPVQQWVPPTGGGYQPLG